MIATGTPLISRITYGVNTGSPKSAVLHVLRDEIDAAREVLVDDFLHALRAVA